MTREYFHTLLASGEMVVSLTNYLMDHPKEISQLIHIGLHEPQKGSWRALWVADKIHEKKPELIRPFLPLLHKALPTVTDESKLRHLLKIISLNPIPADQLTFLLDFCIGELTNAARAVAIRVHAMQLLFEISMAEPEFQAELIQLIEHEMAFHASPGILSRGKKLLKKLYARSRK
ncbi:hypothetical protein [Sunxiuqinia sp. sy24]|uniref:hypothetical protein n=1 Tax=Sunxiuqinia sp. sy24 TaxID=3461495 RepID=UPI004045B9B5